MPKIVEKPALIWPVSLVAVLGMVAFTPAIQAQEQAGTGQGPGGLGAGFGQGGRHMGGHHVPGWREIKELPDLTDKQRQQIEPIYKQLAEEMRATRGDGGGGALGGGGSSGATGGGNGSAEGGHPGMMGQFMAKRQEAWEKVKPLLTQQQLDELKAMHGHGPGGGSGSGSPERNPQ